MIQISSEVRGALDAGAPLVALESTVIAHGLPYPRNVEVAVSLEKTVTHNGAVPATIGLVDGRPVIGMTGSQIERFAAVEGVSKASARDLGPLCAAGRSAATTVAATARLASLAGIGVFATGGIGGVHRGGERSLDVSADLGALARTPVAVVCAGAKAILDLPRTLEMLETLGVPIIGLRTQEFPAFYTPASGLSLEHHAVDEASVADMIRAHLELNPDRGVLVCNPPPERAALEASEVSGWIEQATEEAGAAGVTGGAVTPWLLDRLAGLSGGRSVETNVALLESNAMAAAKIAVALTRT